MTTPHVCSSSVAAPRAQPRILSLRSRRSTSNCTHFLQQRIDPRSSFSWLRVDSCSPVHGGAYSLCQPSGGSALSSAPMPCLTIRLGFCSSGSVLPWSKSHACHLNMRTAVSYTLCYMSLCHQSFNLKTYDFYACIAASGRLGSANAGTRTETKSNLLADCPLSPFTFQCCNPRGEEPAILQASD